MVDNMYKLHDVLQKYIPEIERLTNEDLNKNKN